MLFSLRRMFGVMVILVKLCLVLIVFIGSLCLIVVIIVCCIFFGVCGCLICMGCIDVDWF